MSSCCASNLRKTAEDLQPVFPGMTFRKLYLGKFRLIRESAYAVPTLINCASEFLTWRNRRGQPPRSAMQRPRPGQPLCLIGGRSAPGKYEEIREKFSQSYTSCWHLILR